MIRCGVSVVLILLLALLPGCSGSKGVLRFDDLRYPASMSPALYDSDGQILYYKKKLEAVGKIDHTRRIWGLFYTFWSINKNLELGNVMNFEIEKYGGEGIVNLSVKSSNCTFNWIAWFIGVSLLPIWPGCTVVSVYGDIVKKSEK